MPDNPEPFPDERLALLLLSGRPGKAHPPENPRRFLSLCQNHGISALVLKGLRERNIEGPAWEGIREDLEACRRQWLARNIYLLDRLRRFHDVLRRAGIPCIVLKGASLLGLLYADFGLRPMADLDVLVRRRDLDRILRRVGSLGLEPPPETEVRYWKERFYHLAIRADDGLFTMIELHWDLEKRFRHSIELAELWERAVRYQMEGHLLNRLSNEDLVLHLLVHLAHHYYRPRLVWVHDIREMAVQSTLDWDRILARAERWRLQSPVFYGLRYVEKIYPGVLPREVLAGTGTGWGRRAILKAVGTGNPLELTVPLGSPVVRMPFSLYFIDRPVDMARFLFRNVGPKLNDYLGRG